MFFTLLVKRKRLRTFFKKKKRKKEISRLDLVILYQEMISLIQVNFAVF